MSSIREGLVKSAQLLLPRRGFLGLLTGALVTPAIIKVASLMRISPQPVRNDALIARLKREAPKPKIVWFAGYNELRWNDEKNRWEDENGPLAVSLIGAYNANFVEIPARQSYSLPLQGLGPEERQALLERWKTEGLV